MNRKLRILIVEDEEIERKVLEMMLKYNRQDIEELLFAENGIEALSLFQDKIPDIVLMDINLPGINGLETIRQMQLMHTGVRFVILSAYNLYKADGKAKNHTPLAGKRLYLFHRLHALQHIHYHHFRFPSDAHQLRLCVYRKGRGRHHPFYPGN